MPKRQTIRPSVTARQRPSRRDRQADDRDLRPATIEQRLAVMEALMQLQAQRIISMQAQLDHVASRGRS